MSDWLTTAEVERQLGVGADPQLLQTITDAAAAWVERVQPKYRDGTTGLYDPPDDVRQGAVLEACEEYNRRGASTNPAEYTEFGIGYVPTNPLTFRLLRIGKWADPVVA